MLHPHAMDRTKPKESLFGVLSNNAIVFQKNDQIMQQKIRLNYK